MRDRESGFVHPRLVVGLIIMALGTMFLLDELNIVDFDDFARLWPLAPIAIGLTMAAQPAGTTNRAFGGFLAVAGAWILLYDFDFVPVGFWEAWPVFLIGFGAWLVWRSFGQPEMPRSTATAPGAPTAGPGAPGAGPSVGMGAPGTDADIISGFAFLCGIDRGTSSRNFQAADATAIMGGCTIDLRGADMGAEPAVVDTFAFWGGIDILVPHNWIVDNKVLAILGGAENHSRPAADATKHLLVRGTALMGGVRIGNEPSED